MEKNVFHCSFILFLKQSVFAWQIIGGNDFYINISHFRPFFLRNSFEKTGAFLLIVSRTSLFSMFYISRFVMKKSKFTWILG